MATAKLSRRKIAAHLADELISGKRVTNKLAAYLIETKRTRELELFVRDIKAALAERGVLLADVVSARELANDTKNTITDYLKKKTGAKDVHLQTTVDPSLLGGVRIETPDRRLDRTIREQLRRLKALHSTN